MQRPNAGIYAGSAKSVPQGSLAVREAIHEVPVLINIELWTYDSCG